jgi:hypothetical protein
MVDGEVVNGAAVDRVAREHDALGSLGDIGHLGYEPAQHAVANRAVNGPSELARHRATMARSPDLVASGRHVTGRRESHHRLGAEPFGFAVELV